MIQSEILNSDQGGRMEVARAILEQLYDLKMLIVEERLFDDPKLLLLKTRAPLHTIIATTPVRSLNSEESQQLLLMNKVAEGTIKSIKDKLNFIQVFILK
jgi:hypothetical protein